MTVKKYTFYSTLICVSLFSLCISCKEHEDIINDVNSSESKNPSTDSSDGTSSENGYPNAKIKVETGNVEPGSCYAKAYGKISGTKDAVEVGFLFGGTADLSLKNGSKSMATTANSDYWITIKGLVDDCVNYYRAYALVDGIYYYGNVKSFETYRLTYVINDKEYLMVKVEDGIHGDFSIMQTEIPISGNFYICGQSIPFDSNSDGYLIRSEFRHFIESIRDVTGLEFRLPTSDEWHYAACGGKFSAGYLYSGSDNIDDVAWYSGNSGGKLHPIAQKKPNELGLYDMSGNYSEVVQSVGEDYSFIDGQLYGGNYTKGQFDCKTTSYYNGNRSASQMSGTNLKHLNAIDKMETVRLVYSRY